VGQEERRIRSVPAVSALRRRMTMSPRSRGEKQSRSGGGRWTLPLVPAVLSPSAKPRRRAPSPRAVPRFLALPSLNWTRSNRPGGPVSEAAGGAPAAARSSGGRDVVRRLLRKAMSVLRGDKYMVGAYPPDWPDPSTTPSKER